MNLHLSITQNVLLFLFSGAVIWYFSDRLSGIVEFIADEFKLGDGFGGTIMLAIVTNLPEIVIVVTGVEKGDTSLALGNILGGIGIQTVLLVLYDFASRKNETKPLSTLTSNRNSIAQGLFLCAILALVIMGSQYDEMFVMQKVSPIEIMIVGAWILSLIVIKQCETQKMLPKIENEMEHSGKLTKKKAIMLLFVIAVIILFFGVLLAETSENIANHFNISGVIFGATILSLVTATPEISGGLAFVKHKRYPPLISDIFGGNSFLPILFFVANILAGRSILTDAHKTDIYLTSLSIVLTVVFLLGMIIQSPKRKWGMGIDSWVALIIYIGGIVGLLLI
jgi:cation:H+ antiporter